MSTVNTEERAPRHTHRAVDGTRYHIMQYQDLAVCGEYLPEAIEGEPGLGQKCVACGVAVAK